MGRYGIARDSDGKILNNVAWDGSTPCDFEAIYGPVTLHLDESGESKINGWYGGGAFHDPMPKITGIDPDTGAVAGGTAVTVTGENLNTPGVAVKFDGVVATNIQNQGDTSLQCDTPAHDAGQVDVTVENDAGTWTGHFTLSSGYEYIS